MISIRLVARFSSFLFVVAAATAPALADTIRVPKDFATIGEALENAAPTDRVIVSRGVYRENVSVDLDGVQIIGKGAIWDGTVDGRAGNCLDISGDGNLVRGFTFRNCETGVIARGNDNTISRCTARRVTSAGFRMEGLFVSGRVVGLNVTVERCTVRGSLGRGIEVDADSATLSRNVVRQCSERGVRVFGDRLTADRNSIQNVGGPGILVAGIDAVLTGNRVRNAQGDGLQLSGEGLQVEGNRVSQTGQDGIFAATVDGAVVSGNRVTGTANRGMFVAGSGLTVQGNRVNDALSGVGLQVQDGTPGSGTRIEGNRVADVSETGLLVQATDADVVGNVVSQAGFGCVLGISISGEGNRVVSNAVQGIHGSGIGVFGGANRLTGNVVRDCSGDGYYLFLADASRIESCSAIGCDAQGLANLSVNVIVVNSTFRRNGLDVGTDETFAEFIGNRVGSGGTETPVLFPNCLSQ